MNFSENITPPENWFSTPRLRLPLIICGPCSAETENQIISTAREIAKIPAVQIFRAGVWKPRTRPNSFEGAGNIALKWLQQVKAETGLLVTVEVARPEHVEACLEHGIDILWIGARTTANPFSIQELAESLKGTDIPVLVKNPVNPDPDQWSGTLERFHKIGITKLGAILRGFYPYEKTHLRNIPKWEYAIELKSKCNRLPVICDASHIAGKAELVETIAQKALDLNFDGLMIETHINPETALSDAKQQLTIPRLQALLDNLSYRNADSDNTDFMNRLEQFREQIDSVDFQMLELLMQRMKIVSEIGKYKSDNNVAIFQLRRWENIIKTRMDTGLKGGLSHEFVKALLDLVHKESIQIQTEIMQRKKTDRLKSSS